VLSKDRSGETCPFCGKGKLSPIGPNGFEESVPQPETGEYHSEDRLYECDTCHKRTGLMGTWQKAGMIAVGTAEVKSIKDRPKDKK
jgi:uncharacterized protein with PIN domain